VSLGTTVKQQQDGGRYTRMSSEGATNVMMIKVIYLYKRLPETGRRCNVNLTQRDVTRHRRKSTDILETPIENANNILRY
jgi:hypothetical protein